MQVIQFSKEDKKQFYSDLRKRVNQYFENNKISKDGRFGIWIKAFVMISLYLGPYVLMYFNVITHPALFICMWVVMALGMSGIGLSVMHDANHGTFTKSKGLNGLVGSIINLVGGAKVTWNIQHNVLHHTYTNVEGMDDDIETIPLMRFSPSQKWMKIHKYQHIYAWFFYALMTLNWATAKDFIQLIRYKKENLIRTQNTTFTKELVKLIVFKLAYYTYLIVLPIIFFDVAWYWVVLGYVTMHLLSGLILSLIFQSAHVMDTTEFHVPKDGKLKNNWAVHQVLTTTNFAPRSKWFTWFIGGLNYQIEHHLFPSISHVHYRKISKIVREVVEEYGLPYNVKPSFFNALASHGSMLRRLGMSA
ncbi:MAG: acyl-CoA desaturase [Flavobacteriales bacterium]|nr:acyl-CoA desaturase [Flavobacteriales bacterium]